MAQMTLQEAELQLVTVQAAISNLIAGKRINQLRVGSGTFSRLYVFSEIMLSELKEHRDELLQYINSMTETLPVFKKNMTIPLLVRKLL